MLHSAVIIISDGLISGIRPQVDDQRGSDNAERVAGWVIPGFVDTHCHGGGGHDFATTDPQEALAARDLHRAHGTTSILASLITDEVDILTEQVGTLRELVASGDLAGIHLEGPFLSPAKPGAHDPAPVTAPGTATP